ncbi:hypothetical protein KO561_12970 [Radiobacillus kanasensis]|uniref:hypothetical protein n=1 Tax=Radiobacillus kanasensis TaxID=2844358 RepID=UPI001E534898|nr:hypothetical protein [Radiobacillus kanasensis]UFT98114.1 hypothetical protein KO561_12970 [Radiobacillus kanasensis]
MDYKVFYSEVADWINQSNQKAIKHGLTSNDFWEWVMTSAGELCDRYGNNELVKKQMVMLIEWLEDVYKSQSSSHK